MKNSLCSEGSVSNYGMDSSVTGSGHGPLGRPVRRSRSKERNVGPDKSKTRPTPPSFRDQQSRDKQDVLVARSLTASQRVCDRPVQMAKWASTYHTNVGPAQARHKVKFAAKKKHGIKQAQA
jgi:hypothetical protein